MVALGIVTLILLVFTLIYYAYIANHSDHDVSFFMSVSLILLVMNLCTNAGGTFGLAWLYLIVSVLFIGLGWAVDRNASVSFYQSIGPWFKKTFGDGVAGYRILCWLIPIVGIVCYFALPDNKTALARTCGKYALWGIVWWLFLCWAIIGIAI